MGVPGDRVKCPRYGESTGKRQRTNHSGERTPNAGKEEGSKSVREEHATMGGRDRRGRIFVRVIQYTAPYPTHHCERQQQRCVPN